MLKIDKLQLEVIINGDPARLKLQELQAQSAAVTKEMRGIKDQELLGKKKVELAALQGQMENIRHEIGLDGMTMKELGQRSKELQTVLNQLKPNTEDFKKYSTELSEVKTRQGELRGSSAATGTSMKDSFVGLIEQMGLGNTKAAEFAKTTVDGMGKGTEKVKGFSGAFSTIKSAIAATGIGLLLIVIGALFAWFEKTSEGSKTLKMAMAGIGAAIDVIVGLFAKLGGMIVDVFSHPVESIKKLWEAIKENIVNRIESVGLLFKSIGKIISSGFTDGYKDLANAAIQATTGIANGIEKMGKATEFAKEKMKEMADAAREAARIEEAELNLAKAKRQSKIDEAKIEREIAKARFDAADKTKEKEQRVNSLLKALNLEKQLEEEQNRIAGTNNKILHEKYDLKSKAGVKASAEEKDALAESDAELIRIETARIDRTRKMSAQKQQLTRQFLDEDIKDIETNFAKQEAIQKQRFVAGEITERQYNDVIIQLNIDQLNAKNKASTDFVYKYKKTGLDLTDIDKSIAENKSKIEDENLKKRKQELDDSIKLIQQNGRDVINIRKVQYEQDLAAAGNNATLRKTIQEKYKDDVLTIELSGLQAERTNLIAHGEKTIEIDKQLADKKAQIIENQFQEEDQKQKEHDAARKEYGLIGMVEQEKLEMDALNAKYDKELITDEEYAKASLAIKLKYASQYISKASELTTSLSNIVQGLQDTEITKNTTKYQKELKDLEDSHNKSLISDDAYNKKKTSIGNKQQEDEKNIKKKYADKAFTLQVAQIIASTAQAAINAFTSLSLIPIVGPALGIAAAAAAVVYGGVQIGQAKAQRDQVKQLATGQYDVIGASDKKLYKNVPDGGEMKTGYYPNKVLLSEKGGEVVIDNPTLKNLQYNAPYVFDIINKNRVKQYAEGSYPAQMGASVHDSATTNNDQLLKLIAANTVVIKKLYAKLDRPIEARMSNERFDIDRAQWDAQRSDVTRS